MSGNLSSGNGICHINKALLTSTKLFMVCKQPLRPTQPPTLSWTENGYWPRGSGSTPLAGKMSLGLHWPCITDSVICTPI